MSLLSILRSWETCKEAEKYGPLCDSISKFINIGVTNIEIVEVNDVKVFNSLLLAPFCDNYPSSVQQSILQLIHFLVIRQPKPDDLLEPALGILASLSNFGDLVRQCVNRKFFEGLNVHKTIEVLFNLLLNGEIDAGGLCAGELLGEMCNEPLIMNLLGSFTKLGDSLNEVISQLRSKDPALVLKLLHLLQRLLENGTNQDVRCSLVNLFLRPSSLTDHPTTPIGEPLENLFSLLSAPNDLVASASVDLIIRLLHTAEKNTENNASATTLTTSATGQLLELAIPALRSASANARQSNCRQSLLRCVLLVRLCELLVHRLKESPDGYVPYSRLVEQLAKSVPPLVVSQLEGNALFSPQRASVDIDTCYTSAGLAIDATGLLYTCAELLATPSNDTSQPDEVSLTQPTGDEEPDSGLQSAAKQCGRSLQELLEMTQMPSLLALGLLAQTSGGHSGLEVIRRTVVLRLLAVIFSLQTFDVELLAHHMDRLQSLPFHDDKGPPKKVARLSSEETSSGRLAFSFLSAWFRSTSEGIAMHHPLSLSQGSFDDDPRHVWSSRRSNSELEHKVDKLLSDHHADVKSPVGKTSEILSIFEYKIRILQSREEVLESSVASNAAALASANRLCEHYRERALISETECSRLRALQLNAVAQQEESHCQLLACAARLEELKSELKEVRSQAIQKQQECQELTQKNSSLQSKLTTAREQNQALDATLDEYRRQLDEAKGQMESQTNQIAKFTQITRLINDLTGNPTADVQPAVALGGSVTLSSTSSGGDLLGQVESIGSAGSSGGGRVSGGSTGAGRKMSTRSNRR